MEKVSNRFRTDVLIILLKINLTATWTSSHKGSLLFLRGIFKVDSSKLNKIRSLEIESIITNIV